MNQPVNPAESTPAAPRFAFETPGYLTTRQLALEEVGIVRNGAILSVIPSGLRAEAQDAAGPLSASTLMAIEVPAKVLNTEPFLGYVADIRGVCNKTAGARAIVVAQVGNEIHKQVIGYGAEHEGASFTQVFSFEQRPNRDSGAPLVPLPPLTLQILVSVQRLNTTESADISVESIDVTAIRI